MTGTVSGPKTPISGCGPRRRARQAEQASGIAVTEANRAWQDTVRPHDDELGMQLDLRGSEARALEAAHGFIARYGYGLLRHNHRTGDLVGRGM